MRISLIHYFFGYLLAHLLLSPTTGQIPPSEAFVRTIELKANGTQNRADIHYRSPKITINGTIVQDLKTGAFNFSGDYTTKQELDPRVKLAFQTYSTSGNLLLLDGDRSEFSKIGSERTARFDYKYTLQRLQIPLRQSEFYIKFNYVKEHEYWADNKYPDIELPTLKITGAEQSESFKTLVSYFPTLLPQQGKVYSFHWFRSTKESDLPYRHKASVEAFYQEGGKRDDNVRIAIENESTRSHHIKAIPFQLNRSGTIQRRLGYVWDGVQWYPTPEINLKTSYVIPFWTYLLICSAASALPFLLFFLAGNQKAGVARSGLRLSSVILVLLVLLEFPSSLCLMLLLSYLLAFLGSRHVHKRYGLYWTLLAFVVANEFIWTSLFESGPNKLGANILSIAIAALALAPIAKVKNRWMKWVLGNSIATAIGIYYATMTIYYLFFGDYPALNVLRYATQGTELIDSMVSYIDSRFALFLIIALVTLYLVNRSAFKSYVPQPQPK